ncbi:MAG: xanthine dehydrogenase family protein subunit M [Pirellulaceae bacterium]
MHAFEYQAPTKLADALALLAQHHGAAKPLAGGTDLIDQMRTGRYSPSLIVDIKKLDELNVLAVADSGLRIGAAVPCHRIKSNVQIQQDYAALYDSSQIIGGWQIQSRASLGGNLCNSGPAGDSIPSMMVLGGACVIAGSNGQREIPVEQFCTGPGKNVLQPGELLVEIRFPRPVARTGSHYRRMIPRNEMDIAVVGVAACVTLNESGDQFADAKIGLAAVAPTPLLATKVSEAIVGQPVNDTTMQNAAEVAKSIVKPITDMRGTAEYRSHVTGVLVKRVLQAAVVRAKGEILDYVPGH